MVKLIYSTLMVAALAAGGSALAQAPDTGPAVGTPEYYNNHGGTLRYPGYIHSAPSTGPAYPYSRQDIRREREVERSIEEARRQHEFERQIAENNRRQRELFEYQQRDRERARMGNTRDRNLERQRQRDRDGDGINNRRDQFPDDPSRW